MEQNLFGYNRGIFCGKVVSAPTFDHNVTDPETDEVIQENYLFEMEVEFENKRKTVKDVSPLPFLISKEQLEELGGVKEGDLLFVKGKLRAFDRREDGKKKTNLRIRVNKAEKVEDFTRTRNKLEVHGYLKKKLYKAEFDEDGKLKRDEKGRPIPVLDENGNRISWTRRNTEGHTVNDINIRVPKVVADEEGNVKLLYQDFIPAIAYGSVAWQIAKEIDINDKVKARGYVRRRPKNGYEGEFVYEFVVTRITPVKEEANNQEEGSSEEE